MILHISPMLSRLKRSVRGRVAPCLLVLLMRRQDEVAPFALLVCHSCRPARWRGRTVIYLAPAPLLRVLVQFGDGRFLKR